MIIKNVELAKAEALKFIDHCDNVLAKKEADSDWYVSAPKQTGALRRSSMDLTRSLSNLRGNKVNDRNA